MRIVTLDEVMHHLAKRIRPDFTNEPAGHTQLIQGQPGVRNGSGSVQLRRAHLN